MNLPRLIESYLRHLAEALGRSPTTVAGAREELGLLVKRGITIASAALTAHLTWLPDGRLLAPTTRNRRLAILRGFVRFLQAEGLIPEDPLVGVRRAKLPRRVREAIGARELHQVLVTLLAEPRRWHRTRDATLLLLHYYTGLRLTEVARLDIDQVDLAAGVLRRAVRKGGDITDTVLHPVLASQLAIWLRVRGESGQRALFARRSSGRLSPRSIQLRLHRMGERAGLAVRLHPHLLRHAHATGLLRSGVTTAVIQQSMNHRALATTELYLHGDLELVRAGVERLPVLPVVSAEP